MTVHDLISVAFPFQHRMQTVFFVAMLPRVIAAAEHLVTISHTTRDALAQHLPTERVRAASAIVRGRTRTARRTRSEGEQQKQLEEYHQQLLQASAKELDELPDVSLFHTPGLGNVLRSLLMLTKKSLLLT